jgi:hypothetical protein
VLNAFMINKNGRPTFQKAWEDKMKRKVEQMNKGTKPPFFRNTVQGNPIPKESRMTEIVEKIQGNNLFNVGVVANIICGEISFKEVIMRGLHIMYKKL